MADPLDGIDMVFRLEHAIKKQGRASTMAEQAALNYAGQLRLDGWRWDANADPTVSHESGVRATHPYQPSRHPNGNWCPDCIGPASAAGVAGTSGETR